MCQVGPIAFDLDIKGAHLQPLDTLEQLLQIEVYRLELDPRACAAYEAFTCMAVIHSCCQAGLMNTEHSLAMQRWAVPCPAERVSHTKLPHCWATLLRIRISTSDLKLQGLTELDVAGP